MKDSWSLYMCKYFPAGTGGDFFILNWMEVIGKGGDI